MPQHSLLCWSKYFQEHLNIFGEKYLFCCKILPESSSESSPECFLKVLLKVFWKFLLQDSAWKFFWWWSPTACHCSQPLPGSGNNTGKMCHNPESWNLVFGTLSPKWITALETWNPRHQHQHQPIHHQCDHVQAGWFRDGTDAHLPLSQQPRGSGTLDKPARLTVI